MSKTEEKDWWGKWQDTLSDGITLTDDEETAVHKALQYNRARNSVHTFRNRKVVARQFIEFCDLEGISILEADDIVVEDWMTYLLDEEYAPRSVRGKIYALSSLFQRWERRELVDENPVEKVDDVDKLELTRIEEHSEREYLTKEEYKAMLNACDILRDRVCVELLWNTGVRAAEAIAITEDDIDRDNQSIEVETIKGGRYSKNNDRTVYYNRQFERTLRDWLDRGGRDAYLGTNGDDDKGHLLVTREAPHMADGRLNYLITNIAEDAGIQSELYVDKAGRPRNRVNCHLFRKSYGVHRTKNGMPIAYLTELMGHSDIEVTKEHYLKFRDDDLEEAEIKYRP